MEERIVLEEDLLGEIDWENLLQSIPDSLDLFPDDINFSPEQSIEEKALDASNPSPESDPSWLSVEKSVQEESNQSPNSDLSLFSDIEHFLLEEDSVLEDKRDFSDQFFSDILLDTPDARSVDVRASSEETQTPEPNSTEENQEKESSDVSEEKNADEEGIQLIKKRKRQLRNRDSAMKSRERKKLYVRELEMKSKYLEGECKRLEYALQCCVMENQILHQRLQNDKASGASASKQESAVLPLESLLLGSLFWLLSIACLFLLPALPVTKPMVVIENAGNPGGINVRKTVEVRKPRNEELRNFMKRRCKWARTKMKAFGFSFQNDLFEIGLLH